MKFLSGILCVVALLGGSVTAAPRVLVFSKTLGFRHESITNGIALVRDLGAAHQFEVESSEDADVFTATNLARFQAVVFLSVTGDVLNQEQEHAFQNYMENGGGFVGVHGSLFGPRACEDQWAWYGEMCCCTFAHHSNVLPAILTLEDTAHPANAGLPARWDHTDEWYNFTGTPRGRARVLATVDESTYVGGTMGADNPVVWCRRVGKGRMWYTALGHTRECFAKPLFQRHLLNGIRLAAGWETGDFSPNTPPPSGSK